MPGCGLYMGFNFFLLLELKNPGAAYTVLGGGLYTEQYGILSFVCL